jgi:hypothetical protein
MIPLIVNGPAIEPIALADAKKWLRLQTTDDDDVIGALITAARLMVEAQIRRMLITQSWRLIYDCWPGGRLIKIPLAPFQSLTAMRTYDAGGTAQAVSSSLYYVDSSPDAARIIFWRTAGGAWAGKRRDRNRRRSRLRRDGGERARAASPGDPHAGHRLIRESRRCGCGRSCERAAVLRPCVGCAVSAAETRMRKRAFVDVMRQRLSLDAASESSDESGALQTTWVAQGHLWGQIIPASSGERFLADRQEETVTHRIR